MSGTTAQRLLIFPMLVALLIGVGCSDDDPVTPPAGSDPLPATPDELAAEFLKAYEGLDHGRSLALLDSTFVMGLQPETTAQFPFCGSELDRAEMDSILARMFSDDDMTTRDGAFLPGTKGLTFQVFLQQGDWEDVPQDQEFGGSMKGLFVVDLLLLRGESYPASRVQGEVLIYAQPHPSDIAGNGEIHYTLSGMVDLTGNKTVSETTNWGNLLALYYPPSQ